MSRDSKTPEMAPSQMDTLVDCKSSMLTDVLKIILITIENGKYTTTLYDKRDSFQFDIVNFPDMSSNIPSKPAYGVYISQLVCIGRIYSTYKTFCERHHKLTKKLIKQGFRYAELCKAFKKFTKIHHYTFHKYGCSIKRHLQDGVCLPVCDGFLSCFINMCR